MKLILCLCIFSMICSQMIAQKKIPEHYSYPFDLNYQPLTLRVNAILLKRTDGTGNFDLNDSEQKQLLIDYLENI